MADTAIYLGRPGALTAIPAPRGGVDSTRQRVTSLFQVGAGGVRVARSLEGRRQYTLSYASLDYATAAVLEAYDQGHMGAGPFVLLDPGRRNILTANQSAATSVTNDSSNFTVAGSGGTLSSDATLYRRGPRSLKWSFAVSTPATATLTLDSPSSYWPGIPVAIRPYTFTCYVQGSGTDAIMTVTPQITWLTAAGGTVSTSSGSTATSAAGSWTQATVTATAPATTAYAVPTIAVTGSTITAGGALNLDQFQFEEGSTVGAWVPGTGILPVAVVSLAERWPWMATDYREQPVLVLQEVG